MKKLKRISLLMLALVLSLSMVFTSTFVFALEGPETELSEFDEAVEELAEDADEPADEAPAEDEEQLEEEKAEEPAEEPAELLSGKELSQLPGGTVGGLEELLTLPDKGLELPEKRNKNVCKGAWRRRA